MDEFLKSTDVIDWQQPEVVARARALRGGLASIEDIARRCFEWVRDEVTQTRPPKKEPQSDGQHSAADAPLPVRN